jgi:hypothetical protein
MKRIIGALLLAGLLAAGCASTFDFRRQELFENSVKSYANLIRWSEFEAARRLLAEGGAAEGNLPLRNVRVSDYQVKKTVFAQGSRQVIQVVEISYHKIDDPRIRTVTDQQLWEFDEEKSAWLNKSGFPKF